LEKYQSLIEIGIKKRNGDIKDSWDSIGMQFGISGEKARDIVRKHLKKIGKLPKREEVVSSGLESKLNLLDLKIIDLDKEKIKVRDQKREFRKIVTDLARYEYLQEVIQEVAEDIKKDKPFKWLNLNHINSDKEGVLIVSDWHSNLEINNYLNTFNKEEFKRRINRLVVKTIEHGKFHNIKTLHVLNLSDLIAGLIHVSIRVSSNEDNITQLMYVSEILSEMLMKFSDEFEYIKFYSVIDNHSRVTSKKDESIDKENLSRIIPWYVKSRVSDILNIEVIDNILDDGVALLNICGHLCFGSHGDKDRITNATQNLSLMFKMFPEYIFLSHFHHLQSDEVHSCELVVNSSLIGVDSYSFGKRLTSKPAQMFIVFNEEEGREASYSIRLDI
jgi:hypothetical protein